VHDDDYMCARSTPQHIPMLSLYVTTLTHDNKCILFFMTINFSYLISLLFILI